MLRKRARVGTRDKGAALVEFALLMPLLIILILGIVEFGWKFGQFNDVRHAAREGARFAAVNAGTDAEIEATICSSLDLVGAGITEVRLAWDPDPDSDGVVDIGESATIRLEVDVSSLSGLNLISIVLPTQLASDIQFRLEQPATSWSARTLSVATATGCT
jgi:Flp pilus assembly protein TadG